MSLIAVCSGKGAPGASFVALNLAASFARSGSPVMLADLDTAGGDLGAYLRLDARHGVGTLLAIHGNAPSPEALRAEAVERAGMRVLAGVSDPVAAVGLMRRELAAAIRATGERAVCDFGRVDVIGAPHLREADQVIVVVRPDLVSVLGAQRAIASMRSWVDQGRFGIVVNAARARHPGDVTEVRDALEVPCLGVIPFDPRGARRAMLAQTPALSKHLVGAFDALGRALSLAPRQRCIVPAAPRVRLGEAVAS